MTRVVFAPDSFKGTITAEAAARALASGWVSVDPNAIVISRPMADGGEGTVAAFATAIPGSTLQPVTVTGPAGDEVEATWLRLPDGTAVVDLASTSGIELLRELRPWDADSTGLGQALCAAADHGAPRLIVGIGSSASTDGGTGMLSALGARFLDTAGRPVARGARGLTQIAQVDLSALRTAPEVLVLTDVSNPLVGEHGAAAVFGPQKGLKPDDIPSVDTALRHLAGLLGLDPSTPGAGAAGGVGGALLTWGGVLAPGADTVADLIGLRAALADADVVITGEGSYDAQSAAGKVPAFVASLARQSGTIAMLAAGAIAPDADTIPFAGHVSLSALAGSASSAMASPSRWLHEAGRALAERYVAAS